MASKVEICNMALAAVGSKAFIESIDEASTEANVVRTFWNAARDAVLRAHDWPFARKRAMLSLITADESELPTEWGYCYGYPGDCAKMRFIEDGFSVRSAEDAIPFIIGLHGGARCIYSNQEEAYARYTSRVEDEAIYPPEFIEALQYDLASRIAVPITGKRDILDDIIKLRAYALAVAIAASSNEEAYGGEPDSSLIAARE